MESEREARRLR
ncbi:hypothetical protein PUMCH_001356 [Australozyma saopauloensis]|nr:hypothetical protein PUMCH_001356 [[Candida] saopauloensis]CUM47607.1 unnamed protein product [Debaryomyces fabryi]